MPKLTRWFIKTGLLYLVVALLTGVLTTAGAVTALPYPFASLSNLYIQILMAGWLTQLIFGVANWMFPVFSREAPRGNEQLGWASYALLNAGLVLHILIAFLGVSGAVAPGWLAGVASVFLFLAALAFVANTWQRVKGH